LKDSEEKLETKAIHAGEPHPRIEGAINVPIFQSAMFETPGGEGYHNIRYIRLNNTPNHLVIQQKLASLEGAEDALVTSSGMAAITSSLLAFLSNGDHLLIQDCLYGGTHDFVTKDLGNFGIEYNFIDGNDPNSWKQKLKENTKAIYVETMTNPLLGVADLEAVAEFAKSHHLVSMIDNTFATPVNFRPLEHGFDLSLHSATKYLNGHSDIVAGAVIGNSELVAQVKKRVDHFGGSLDPHACYLLYRGVKTLPLRMKQHNQSALEIARYLEQRNEVGKVNYPGLSSHPQHERAAALFDGYSGMLSFELKDGKEAATKFLRSVTIPVIAPSLGSVDTLMTIPALTSHSGLSREDRERIGITDGLIRLSVGIESPEDIIRDFDRAFEEIAPSQILTAKQ
jgi:cystathionine beta-lyase/cystathionine gamma-synthase